MAETETGTETKTTPIRQVHIEKRWSTILQTWYLQPVLIAW